MERKDSKRNWKKKNSGWIFAACLVGVAAFSALFAMNQVKQAEKVKNQQIQEEASLNKNTGQADDSFVPQVDAALQEALQDTEGLLDAAQGLDANLEEAASRDVTAENADGIIEDGDETGSKADTVSDTEAPDAAEASAQVQPKEILPTVTFNEADILNWPVAGNVLIDYSMDGSVYFPTLDQYKYNPALVIGSETGAQVVAASRGIVESIAIDEETGTTVTMSLGDGYRLKYGQLKELNVAEGDVVNQGDLIGYVSEPTRYYCVEGSNLYFAMTKDEVPVDPVLYLE
ncbi:MAG: M23 family metallopeptidase [Lachnospiraceae bacterium]|nr:M23 family metallopeptidase [Lachnospiraceae bacterium]